MTRMNLEQLTNFLFTEGYVALAMDFSDLDLDQENIVDFELDVQRINEIVLGLDPSGKILREIQANVTSYVYLEY